MIYESFAIDSFIRPQSMQLHMYCGCAREAIECITSYEFVLSILNNNEKNADILNNED
jgi:hypothetical protein